MKKRLPLLLAALLGSLLFGLQSCTKSESMEPEGTPAPAGAGEGTTSKPAEGK